MASYNISVDSASRWLPDNGVDVPGFGRVQIGATKASAITSEDAADGFTIAMEQRELTYASFVQT